MQQRSFDKVGLLLTFLQQWLSGQWNLTTWHLENPFAPFKYFVKFVSPCTVEAWKQLAPNCLEVECNELKCVHPFATSPLHVQTPNVDWVTPKDAKTNSQEPPPLDLTHFLKKSETTFIHYDLCWPSGVANGPSQAHNQLIPRINCTHTYSRNLSPIW